ncbi:hypothetical protein [Aquihabitans sp. McL0605]|uniref:hypothetical protein n=1 Tax=Aquihabitans sp. McL0605 TaxID=3415671 RepID=UPI003CFA2096
MLGVQGTLVLLAMASLMVVAILVLVRRSRRLQMSRIEAAGAILAAPCFLQLTSDQELPDLNHRTATTIGVGELSGGRLANGVFSADATAMTINVVADRTTPAVVLRIPWVDVSAAEILPLRGNVVTLVLHRTDGRRHRIDVTESADRVASLLHAAGVAEEPTDAVFDPQLVVGARVAARGESLGTVVGLSPRAGEPGHAEVFVRLAGGETESWDSSALRVVPS